MRKRILSSHLIRWFILISIICGVMPSTAFAGFAVDKSLAPLHFLGNKSLPPMVYLENGTPKGIIVDIAEALGKKMDRPVNITAMDWSEAQKIVERGEADALLQINQTEERKKIYDFSDPLLESKFLIFTLANRTGIADAADLRGLKVGVEAKGLPRLVLQSDPLIELVNVPSILEGFRILKAGGIDAVVVDQWVGTYILASERISDVVIAGAPITTLQSSIAVKKGNTELLSAINQGLREMKADGTYESILEKWKPYP